MNAMLGAITNDRKMRVGNIEVGIDAKCRAEIAGAIGSIPAKEKTIVEIPVGA